MASRLLLEIEWFLEVVAEPFGYYYREECHNWTPQEKNILPLKIQPGPDYSSKPEQ